MPELKEKLIDLKEAASLINDGTRLALGGFGIHNHPIAFVHELIRKSVKDLVIVGHVNGIEVDMLVGAGCVQKVETSCVGLEEFGLAPCFRRAVELGELRVAEYSETIAFERFMCSSRGQSFFPTRQLMGTDLPRYNTDIKEVVNPFDGFTYHAISPAEPEWVVIHAPMGDRYGNILFFDNRQLPSNLDLIMAQTTRNLIVTVEQIVERDRVFRLSHMNAVPRFRTTAIVEVPYGAHPSSCLQVYDCDKEHMKMYAEAARDIDGFNDYLGEYIYGVDNHTDYLKLIGIKNLMKLRFVGGSL